MSVIQQLVAVGGVPVTSLVCGSALMKTVRMLLVSRDKHVVRGVRSTRVLWHALSKLTCACRQVLSALEVMFRTHSAGLATAMALDVHQRLLDCLEVYVGRGAGGRVRVRCACD